MDAPIFRRPVRRPSLAPRPAATAIVLLLACHAVQADDAPARRKAEGGGYAVVAPAGTCAAGDVIFADGFE